MLFERDLEYVFIVVVRELIFRYVIVGELDNQFLYVLGQVFFILFEKNIQFIYKMNENIYNY